MIERGSISTKRDVGRRHTIRRNSALAYMSGQKRCDGSAWAVWKKRSLVSGGISAPKTSKPLSAQSLTACSASGRWSILKMAFVKASDYLAQRDTWLQSRPVFHGVVITAMVTDQGGLDVQVLNPRLLPNFIPSLQADLPGFIAWLTGTFT